MADLQQQLQAILGDPQAMDQITAIARALTGGAGQAPSPAPEEDFVPTDPPPAQPAGAEAPPPGPDLSALLGGLGGNSLPQIDPRLVQLALRVFSEYSAQDDQKAALLAALKPFLKEERREKVEKAERIARLSRVVRLALRLLREEGSEHV